MAKYVKAALRVLAYVLCIFIPYGIDHSITVFTDDPCKPRTMESSGIEGRVETAIYEVVTRSGFRDIRSRYTAVITLRDYELPLELFSDKCKQREFLSTIIRKAADAGASMIVIDKYFSPGSCKDATATGTLAKAIEDVSKRIPIIIGISTLTEDDLRRQHLAPSGQQEQVFRKACLVMPAQLDFKVLSHSDNVYTGLVRLNADIRKIPLSWSTFQGSIAGEPQVQPTLSVMAATTYDPQLSERPVFVEDLRRRIHPLTSFIAEDKFPILSAADVACEAALKVLDYTCKTKLDLHPLRGKIVLIGEDTAGCADRHSTPAGEMPGVFVQANYIESLLDDRYFKMIPVWTEVLMGFIWVIALEYWFEKHKTTKLLVVSRWWLVSMLAFLVVTWVLFQLTGYFVLFGVPAATVGLGLKCIGRIQQNVA